MNLLLSRRALGCAIATIFAERVFAVPAGVGELPARRMLPGETLPLPWGNPESSLGSGALGASAKELAIAKRVVEKAPSTINPYEVAQYFDRVGRGLESPLGEDWKPYVQEWPERYNPVILNFFAATTIRKPEGDCTAWCSAFVNWCIERGRTGRPDPKKLTPITQSAAALSFRDWGRQTSDPKPGDIVVFRNVNTSSHGHVGFYSGQTDDFVIVLGGNQGGLGGLDANESTCSDRGSVGGRVVEQKIRKRGGFLVLHSYRTDQSLHDMNGSNSKSAGTSESKSSQAEKSTNPTEGAGKGEAPGNPHQESTSTNPTQAPDKPAQETTSTNPAQAPDKPIQETTSANPAQAPDKPIQETTSANPAQPPDKPIQETTSANSAQTTIKPPQQTASVNPAQTTIKPVQQTTSAATIAAKETIVEIEFLNGRKLRVGANIDPDILAKLLAVLGK